MAARAFWKGYLKLSLVTCPVAMAPATSENEKVRSTPSIARLGIAYVVTMSMLKPVNPSTKMKRSRGKRGPNQFVPLENQEIEAVALESTRTIDIDMFVPHDSIGWIWYDKPHYLLPDDPVGEEAFSVIRDAMATTGTVGISRLVLYRREQAVMLTPRDLGIVVWTLRYGDEVRDAEPYFGDIGPGKADPKLMSMVTKLIEQNTKPWAPEMVGDPVQARLLDIIASKKKGNRPPNPKLQPERPSNVVSIMDALRKSIAREKQPKKR
jgi:DNA end-binding protein Ku